MKIEKSIEINAPPEQVWPYFVEPEKVLQWYSSFQAFEYTGDQRSGVGTALYIEEKAVGPVMKMDFAVTTWEQKEELAIRMVSPSTLKSYTQQWLLEPTPTGTRFTFGEEIEFPFGILGKLLGLFARRMSEAAVDRMQAKLKALVEV